MTITKLPLAATNDRPEPRSTAEAALPARESHSSITTYRGCPLRYAYRYVERRPGVVSPAQFAFGNAVHAAFEAFGRARIRARAASTAEPGPEVLREALDRKLSASGIAPDEVEEGRRRGAQVLARFLEREAASASVPVAVELGFGVPVGIPGDDAGIRFVGYVDRVDRAPDGSTEIVDYKTGRPRSREDVDADAQLTAYAYGCARGGLRDPATGAVVPPASRLGLYFAEAGELAWTTRTEADLEAFEARLVETLGRIHERAFPARPAPWRCRWCEYRGECPSSAAGDAARDDAFARPTRAGVRTRA